ncbi:MAG: SDR family oxidoreductase [Deltaproteobacteria bacterium]|nr:SDR family oxidoreductase [Deltaproteobacteria bacterium]
MGCALITGASSGIGAAFARRLAAEGHDLVLVARRTERLAELGSELERAHGIRALGLTADLARERDLACVEQAIGGRPALDLLVNGAGFGTRGLFADIPASRTQEMIALHVLAPVRLTRAALPAMIKRGHGAVIQVSSLGAFMTTAHYTTYSATKAYLNTFSAGLRAELAGTGVRVQALCPGLTRTAFMDTAEYADFKYGQVPAWAWMRPEEVVDESLAALREGRLIVIPGRLNRLFVHVMQAPVLGAITSRVLEALGVEDFV